MGQGLTGTPLCTVGRHAFPWQIADQCSFPLCGIIANKQPAWVLISKPPWTQHSMLLCKVLMNCPIRQPCFCSRLQRTRLKYNSQLFPSSRVLASAPQWPQLSYKYSKRQSLWQLLKCSFQLVIKMRMIILIVLKTDPHVAEKPWATLRNV